MATVTQTLDAKVALTFPGTQPSALPSAGYTTSDAVSVLPTASDVIIEVSTSCSALGTGNKQLVVFALASLDGTTFTGTSAADASLLADESALRFLGSVPVTAINNVYVNEFSLVGAFGFVPAAFKVILKQDFGAGTIGATTVSKSEQTTTVD